MSSQCLITTTLLALLCYASLPPDSTLIRKEWLGGAAFIRAYTGGWTVIKLAWCFTGFMHTMEAIMRQLQQHETRETFVTDDN